uniref:fibronectin type III domain-containing protein n=1 Tax=Mesoflavibacter sp. CH_XMU1422-2 TaxID=3107770 RepID=UPI00300AB37F
MKKTTLLICLIALFTSIQSFSQITSYPYSEDFESGDGGWTASGTGTWALGTPAATVINSAASGANSWVTNLTGNYNSNEDSFVSSPIFDLSTLSSPSIEMSIWWESEFSWDGTVLQSSIDGGATWQNVGAFGDPNNWYTDNTINGNPGGQQEGWTGRNGSGSNGWVTARHALVGLAGESSVQLRIAFGSDGSVQDEGFAFDDVSIFDVICPEPLAITATAIGASTAEITWSSGGAETQWNYVLQPAGTGTPTSGTTVGTTTVSESALTPQTDYEVYVQAICGADTSVWAGPYFFTTPAQTNFVLDCVNGGPQTLTYCYENNDTNVFTFTSADGTTPLNITFNAGQVEQNWDELVVLDSDGTTDLNAATPYGNGGDVSGLTYQSTGSTISFQVQSDGSVNCQGSGYTSIDVTVSCATCINPTATFVVVDDCENGDQFLVDVNITSLGDATSLEVSDNFGNTVTNVSTTGTVMPLFGPYSFNTDIIFTVSNEQDVNCVITSQAISLAACPPDNDNPCNATIASVNSDESCTVVNSGTLLEATDSGYPNGSCTTDADDDVWFQFTAVGDQQIIQIQNVVGGFNVDHAVYEGTDCNNLTELYCTTDDFSLTPTLTVGNTYYVRVFSAGSTPTSITFDLCIQTLGAPTYCTDALPICADPTIFYPSIVGDQTAPPYLDYDCLGSQPDPQWNTIQFDDPGDYTFQLAQTNDAGTGLDIDFIVWGPFIGQDTGCFELLSPNIADCSFSATATETITLTGVPANSTYVILITNFSQQSGTYNFTQTSGPTDGTNCDVVCDVTLDYDGIVVEQGTTAPDGESDDINLCGYTSVTLTADTAYSVDSYEWYIDGIYQAGINSSTLVATQSGSYQCVVGGGICDDFTSSIIANINFFDDAIANQAPDMEACDEGAGNASFDLESQTATILGTQSNADFVVTYHETLSDAQSGTAAISSPYVAVDGTVIYVRVEDIDAVGSMSGCASTNTSFNLVVNDAPEAYTTPNQELCDDGSGSNIFDLTLNEAVTIGTQTNVSVSYYTSQIDAETSTNAINNPTAYSNTNSPQTIFVKVENSSASECYAITSFDIALYETPETQFGDVVYEVCPNATTPITVTAIPDNYTSNEVSIVWYDQND